MNETVFMISGRPEISAKDLEELGYFDYGLFYVFDAAGLVERDVLHECYKEVFSQEAHERPCFGPFESQDDLTRFAFKLCEKRESQKTVILSQEEYNQALEEAHSKEELLSVLEKAGRSVENLEGPKKGLFGKIFRT